MQERALKNAQQVYTLYDAAQADGFQLDADAQAEIDSLPETLSTAASSAGYHDADEYLEELFGKGASLESYKEFVTRQQIAGAYATKKQESFTFSDSELESYYQEHKQDYDTVTYRLFTVAAGDNAKADADAMAADAGTTGEDFAKAARDHAPEDSAESYEDDSYTLRANANYSSVSTDYADWLFADGRVPGETQVFATSDEGYAVVMFESREDNHYKTVDVRHILVNVAKSGEDDTSTDEDWEACETAINEILEEWEASDKTEDTFAQMATDHSEDPGSAENGGLYEDVYKGQMVTAFNDWCFDESRQVGDYGVVKTEYGYHLIYFSGYGEEYWKDLADEGKRGEEYDSWYETTSAAYEPKVSSFGMMFANKTLLA